jgi:toxin ParE1/3/4
MTYIVSISQQAEDDLREIFLWYEDKKLGLGLVFRDFFETAISSIKLNPLQFQVRYHRIRIKFMEKFPYGIHNTVVNSEIIILAVFHTSLDPKRWQNK